MISGASTPRDSSFAQPPPPPTDDDGGRGDHREEHKLRLMLILSHFIYARVRGLSKISGFSLGYIQELLEELEDEGLVEVVRRKWSSSDYFIERTLKRKEPPMGHDITAELTEEGRNNPRLVKLLDDLEEERRQKAELTRTQWTVFKSGMVLIGGLIVSYAGVSIVSIVHQLTL